MAKLRDWKPEDWKGEVLKKRDYKTYEEYVEHQKDGLKSKGEGVIFGRFNQDVNRFKSNFMMIDFLKGKNCLCLGARSGAEVKALIDLGNEAIGIDLEPGSKNEYVIKGDFHNLDFGDDEFDVVYTNVLDHVYDLGKALEEVKRVLKSDGYFILEMVAGYEEGGWPGDHESAYWAKAEDFAAEVVNHGFIRVTKLQKVDYVKGLPFRRVILKWNKSQYM